MAESLASRAIQNTNNAKGIQSNATKMKKTLKEDTKMEYDPKDFWKDSIQKTKQDIDFLCRILETCKDSEKERFKSILGNVIHTQIRNQRALEILEGRRKISDLIQLLGEFDPFTEVIIDVDDFMLFFGDIGDFLNDTEKLSAVLAIRECSVTPLYLENNILTVKIHSDRSEDSEETEDSENV